MKKSKTMELIMDYFNLTDGDLLSVLGEAFCRDVMDVFLGGSDGPLNMQDCVPRDTKVVSPEVFGDLWREDASGSYLRTCSPLFRLMSIMSQEKWGQLLLLVPTKGETVRVLLIHDGCVDLDYYVDNMDDIKELERHAYDLLMDVLFPEYNPQA